MAAKYEAASKSVERRSDKNAKVMALRHVTLRCVVVVDGFDDEDDDDDVVVAFTDVFGTVRFRLLLKNSAELEGPLVVECGGDWHEVRWERSFAALFAVRCAATFAPSIA